MKRRVSILILLIMVGASLAVAAGAARRKSSEPVETVAGDQWEYLVVGGSRANLVPTDNPTLRKEPHGPFRNEAFVLEQNMDKLGAKGWELVAIAGPPADPILYFKRRKQ
jgi:hypothetical protein